MTALPVATSTRQTSRSALRDDVAGLLADGHRLLAVVAENALTAENPEISERDLRVGYLFARPAGAGATAPEQRVELAVTVPGDDAWLPTVADLSYSGGRFEREVRDLFGVESRDHPLPMRLVRHAHWPRGWYPLLGRRRPDDSVPDFTEDASSFPFVEVGGDGVYEIPVGPVHAGLIEPGHFRFSVVGETIVRMKARLWYVHRGVERLFEGRRPHEGIELAERISGDTAVGHAVAYALACEEALGVHVPEAARIVRVLLLELERLHCHVADLGMLLNDVAFALGNVHLQRVRENLLRLNESVTGHRLLRGGVTVGGSRVSALPDLETLTAAAVDVDEVVALALDHPMVVDRLAGTAVLSHQDADRLGTLGFVARSSGLSVDARRDHAFVDLAAATVSAGLTTPVGESGGDVRARFLVRAREVQASAEAITALTHWLAHHGALGAQAEVPDVPTAVARGLGIAEAWRGLLCHRVCVGSDGRLTRVKVVDPSFLNWPALPVALADTIVPDFPLANKSFNQSYAGNDL